MKKPSLLRYNVGYGATRAIKPIGRRTGAGFHIAIVTGAALVSTLDNKALLHLSAVRQAQVVEVALRGRILGTTAYMNELITGLLDLVK